METSWWDRFINYQESIGGLLFPEVILVIILVLIGLSAFRSLFNAFLAGREPKVIDLNSVETVYRVCANCKWQGEIPKLRKVCPICGQSNFVE